MTEKQISERWPVTYAYLLKNKDALAKRRDKQIKSWFSLSNPRSPGYQTLPKIINGWASKKPKFTIDNDGSYFFKMGGNSALILNSKNHSLNEILGIINSTPLKNYIAAITPDLWNGHMLLARTVENLPIPEKTEANKGLFKEIETHVHDILTMNGVYKDIEGQYSSLTDEEKSALQETLEAKIDGLVERLYLEAE